MKNILIALVFIILGCKRYENVQFRSMTICSDSLYLYEIRVPKGYTEKYNYDLLNSRNGVVVKYLYPDSSVIIISFFHPPFNRENVKGRIDLGYINSCSGIRSEISFGENSNQNVWKCYAYGDLMYVGYFNVQKGKSAIFDKALKSFVKLDSLPTFPKYKYSSMVEDTIR